MDSVTLFYRNGGSDKVYRAAIEPKENSLFIVTFAYGRRGSALQTGVKTQRPVDRETAERVFQKLVREKTAKGYTPGENAAPYAHTPLQGVYTAILPQLLNAIDANEAERLLSDLNWCLQEKKDGKRLILRKDGPNVQGINRRGLVVSIPKIFSDALAGMAEDFMADGECIGETFYVFDLLELDGKSRMNERYEIRWMEVARLFSGNFGCVKIINTAFKAATKRNAFESLRKQNAEGVVFKLLSAPYTTGRPNSGGPALKFKFTTTGSFIVEAVNGGRSVRLKLFQEEKSCGNVTIPPNHPLPEAGAVVEVQYLYAYRGGSLYQPVYLGERDDIESETCTIDQIKFKAEEPEDDGE